MTPAKPRRLEFPAGFYARLTTEASAARTGRSDDRRPADLARPQEAARPPGDARLACERDGVGRPSRGCTVGRESPGERAEDGAALRLAAAARPGGGLGDDRDPGSRLRAAH